MTDSAVGPLWIIIFILCPPIFFIWLAIVFVVLCFEIPALGYSVLAILVGVPALLFVAFG
jgi:hypothetical protein